MIRAAVFALLFWSWARAEEPKAANPPAPFVIQWNTNSTSPAHHSVAVRGNLAACGRIPPEKLFVIEVEQHDLRGGVGLPAMVGKYDVSQEQI